MEYRVRQLLQYAFGKSPSCPPIITTAQVKDDVAMTAPIPVWSFWQGQDSLTVNLCIASWRKHLPSDRFHINVLNEQTIGDYVDTSHPCFHVDKPALRSDYLRLQLLDRYGGVWLDASVLLTRPLDEWDFLRGEITKRSFNAFYNPSNMSSTCSYPVIETAFMAAPKGHPLVRDWLDRLMQLLPDCSVADMDRYLKKSGQKCLQRKKLDKHYHIVYHMLQHALWNHNGIEHYPNVRLMNTVIYRYFEDDVLRPTDKVEIKPFYKLIKHSRDQTDTILNKGQINPNSIIMQAL